MQLGVETAAGVLAEYSHQQSFGVDTHDVTVVSEPGVSMVLHPAEDCFHRTLMSLDHLRAYFLGAEGEEDRHRLGGGEGGVIPPHRPFPVSATQILPGGRVLACHHRQESLGVDLTGEAQMTSRGWSPRLRWRSTVRRHGRNGCG
jgi:hypothetical protein